MHSFVSTTSTKITAFMFLPASSTYNRPILSPWAWTRIEILSGMFKVLEQSRQLWLECRAVQDPGIWTKPGDTKGACIHLKRCLSQFSTTLTTVKKNYTIETPGGIKAPPPSFQSLFHCLYLCTIFSHPFDSSSFIWFFSPETLDWALSLINNF